MRHWPAIPTSISIRARRFFAESSAAFVQCRAAIVRPSYRNRNRPSAVSFLSTQLQVRLPLATIPPSGKTPSRSTLIPANGWFFAHRRMRFMHSSRTGRSMVASTSKGRSISAAPGLPDGCRPRRCGRPSSWPRWKPACRSMMMKTGPKPRL
ncbi:hypothetical protein RL2954 [Rhizobium johnstonii 3841]|uniref:Uncharacterized protein n=1 Tax=Rhizobium johnstonii (strain DSM 114642 / LMG 32736 / 3841) TaxID=216596 RepID=Q1MF30_RHIJ3|nr:hypothetical protein RL2954 [Rhizobium johnstonii 3841]